MTKTICEIYNDAEIMEYIMVLKEGDVFLCPGEHPLTLREIRERANSQGSRLPLVSTLAYRRELSYCEKCKNFIGEMPKYKQGW